MKRIISIIIILAAAVICFLGLKINNTHNTAQHRCSESGCRNLCVSGEDYCQKHFDEKNKWGDTDESTAEEEYEDYDYSSSSPESTDFSEEDTDNSAASTRSSTRSTQSSRSGSNAGSSGKRKKSYGTDSYGAGDYDNADDFADDWAEEFGDGDYDSGYDDAADYWEEGE